MDLLGHWEDGFNEAKQRMLKTHMEGPTVVYGMETAEGILRSEIQRLEHQLAGAVERERMLKNGLAGLADDDGGDAEEMRRYAQDILDANGGR